jgi:branched-subunit amino acid aminotransferase/4-amino-4-deoxychorismate lyase
MLPDDEKLERVKQVGTGLESYHRLIELQKQMIKLSQHHERFRRECDALRDVVTREAVIRHSRAGLLRVSFSKLFQCAPFVLARQLFS